MNPAISVGTPPVGRALFSARPANAASVDAALPTPVAYVPFDAAATASPAAIQDTHLGAIEDTHLEDGAQLHGDVEDTHKSEDTHVAEEADGRAVDPQSILLPGFAMPSAALAPDASRSKGSGDKLLASGKPTQISTVGSAVTVGVRNQAPMTIERAHAELRAVVNAAPIAVPVPGDASLPMQIAIERPVATGAGVAREVAVTADQLLPLIVSPSQDSLAASSFVTARAASADAIVLQVVDQPTAAAKQPLAALLGERLHVQIRENSERAVIRLDPPSMGSIEISIRHEAGTVQVQMRASHPDVARQLHALSDALRQDLSQRQFADVSVQISEHSRDAGERQRQRQAAVVQDEPGRALNSGDGHTAAAFALDAEAADG
jgi:flagellar hook-length control protein FliK